MGPVEAVSGPVEAVWGPLEADRKPKPYAGVEILGVIRVWVKEDFLVNGCCTFIMVNQLLVISTSSLLPGTLGQESWRYAQGRDNCKEN